MAKICIDAGHYGKYNHSPGVKEYYESDMTWKLSQLQKKYLEKLGHTVIMTRTDKDKDLSLSARGKASKGCDLFISNHSNAVANTMNETVSYAAVYHLVDDKTTKCDDISVEIAKVIGPAIAEVMGISYKLLDRKGTKNPNANYYGVLNGARQVQTPGLILEHGFHTHTKTTKWLLKDSNLEKLAKKEAEVIDAYFRGTKKETSKSEAPKSNTNKASTPFKVKIEIDDLNIRKGPGTNYDKNGCTGKGVFTITEVSEGKGSSKGWGKLKSGAGWISLGYATRI